MRHFFEISYNGGAYHGWQRLPHSHSIQEVIENTLAKVFKTKVSIVGCGRTDSGVHASQFFFHLDHQFSDERAELVFKINKNLPDDISLLDIIPVGESAHARFHAISRTYEYFIHLEKDPFLDKFSAFYPLASLSVERMLEGVKLLTGFQDYKHFHRLASQPNTTICHVTEASLFADANGRRIRFTISANRFLAGMIRILTRKLLDVGIGKLTLADFRSYLDGSGKPTHLRSAHPQGLHLTKVTYPFLNRVEKHSFVHFGNWKKID